MGENSGIAWTDHSVNFWIGCTDVGPGCAACYARVLDWRYQYGVPLARAAENRLAGVAPHFGNGAPRHQTSRGNRDKVRAWNAAAEKRGVPFKVFANSMSDFFDNEVPRRWRADGWARMRETPWLRYIVLTKRVSNVRKMLPADWGDGYPNVGILATCVTQAELGRDGPRLADVPAVWRGFSIEPQIERIDLPAWLAGMGSTWIIAGGESRQAGHNPRSWDPDWLRRLLGDRPANARIFMKQTGAAPIGMAQPRDGAGADPMAWSEWMRVREFPPELLS